MISLHNQIRILKISLLTKKGVGKLSKIEKVIEICYFKEYVCVLTSGLPE
jgi:hypothetical protein